MIKFLKALIDWCDIATALIIMSADLLPRDRQNIKQRLSTLKIALREFERSKPIMETKTAEQKARDMLERMGVKDAQSFSSGDLVELANLIVEVERLEEKLDNCESVVDQLSG